MAAFNQTFNAPVGQVINTTGNVILTDQSNAADVVRLLKQYQTSIAQQGNIANAAKAKADEKLAAAIDEASKPSPDKAKASGYITEAAKVIEDADKAASGAVSLAKTLFDIGKWLTVFL